MSSIERKIKTVVEELRDAMQALNLRDFDEDSPQELRPGASDADLLKVSALLGGPVPPTYAAFLRLHNGWLKYSGAAQLLPAGEQGATWVCERVSSMKMILEDNEDGEVLENAIVIMLGPNEANFVVMKTDERSEDDELQVIHWDLEEGEFGTFDSFLEFLEDELETAQADLDDNDG